MHVARCRGRAAASRSSCGADAPESPSRAGRRSLTDPRSPRDAHSSTTRAPASASRASVPPQASDSSSGWAKTARMVRPGKRASYHAAATSVLPRVAGTRPRIRRPCGLRRTARRRVAHAPAIEREHARESAAPSPRDRRTRCPSRRRPRFHARRRDRARPPACRTPWLRRARARTARATESGRAARARRRTASPWRHSRPRRST